MSPAAGRFRFCLGLAALAILASCGREWPVSLPVPFAEGALFVKSKNGADGRLRFTEKEKTHSFRIDPPVSTGAGRSLAIEFQWNGAEAGAEAALYLLSDSDDPARSSAWALPRDGAFLGRDGRTPAWSIPLREGRIGGFLIRGKGPAELAIVSIRLEGRWFGYSQEGGAFRATPFVYRENGAFVIDPPDEYRFSAPEIAVRDFAGGLTLEAGTRRYEYRPAGARTEGLAFPPELLSGSPFRLEAEPRSFVLREAGTRPRREPVSLDPGLILAWPQKHWRDPRFELFRWEGFPSVLIFDTADYAVQERFFRRLAFFVEKIGYRGRLLSAAELEGLHGWNAHDYQAEDLARFFAEAARRGLDLFPEEKELLEILRENGILRDTEGGGLAPGTGAVLSLSRESSAALRARFMAHEGFHGLFFTDADFRAFAARRWENFDPAAKAFFLSWLSFQGYDTGSAFLSLNEFMSYCLQQPVEVAASWFGETLARQIDAHAWRREVLPEAAVNEKGERSWPEIGAAFAREAAAFSGYVSSRWGFRAGSVSRFRAVDSSR